MEFMNGNFRDKIYISPEDYNAIGMSLIAKLNFSKDDFELAKAVYEQVRGMRKSAQGVYKDLKNCGNPKKERQYEVWTKIYGAMITQYCSDFINNSFQRAPSIEDFFKGIFTNTYNSSSSKRNNTPLSWNEVKNYIEEGFRKNGNPSKLVEIFSNRNPVGVFKKALGNDEEGRILEKIENDARKNSEKPNFDVVCA